MDATFLMAIAASKQANSLYQYGRLTGAIPAPMAPPVRRWKTSVARMNAEAFVFIAGIVSLVGIAVYHII